MCVPIQQYIAILQRWQTIRMINMAVGGVHSKRIDAYQRIISHDRERQNHLINFGIAIAPNAKDFFFSLVECRNNILWTILIRKIISRTMIENVSEQQHAICFLLIEGMQHFLAVPVGTVNI